MKWPYQGVEMTIVDKRDTILSIEQNLYKMFKPKSIKHLLGLEKTAIDLCCSLILTYFKEQGVEICEGKEYSIQQLQDNLKVKSEYQKMIRFFIAILDDEGYLKKNRSHFVFTAQVNSWLPPDQILKKIAGIYPKFHPFFSFVSHCAKHYSQVFSGQVPGVQILFPSGDSTLLQKIYQATPQIGHEQLYLNLAHEVLLKLSEDKPKPRVIEVGAGQGILTDALMPIINSAVSKYYFTDVGSAFVQQGQHKYRHASSGVMEFAAFDVTLPPEKQGFNRNSFDFLVGFNVLHATQDVGQSLINASTLLKDDGCMILVENTKQQIWIDMIYGLTEGWWAFDDGIREISPLLTRDQWKNLLTKCAFKEFTVLPEKREDLDSIDTSLIVIQKD